LLTSVLSAGLVAASLNLGSTTQPPLRDLAATHALAGSYTPNIIATAYDFVPVYSQGDLGAGVTVALIEQDKYDPLDLSIFDGAFVLPSPSIEEYYAGGSAFQPRDGGETDLDVEWVHALAPEAAIQIYYLNTHNSLSSTWDSMAEALRMAAANGANVVSVSLGVCHPGTGLRATQSALADVTSRGMSVFVSSGDDGDHPGPTRQCGRKLGVAYPSGDPLAVSVGGTSLHLNRDDSIAREVAWKHSGGGKFVKLERLEWQFAPTMPRDRYRWVPDVAFVGDPKTGVAFVHHTVWDRAAGTSLGAPAWAAIWSLILQKARITGKVVDSAQRVIYRIGNSPSYRTAFHDIVAGSNGRYHAGRGWDPVTGWGTPDVAGLAQTVIGLSPSG
jgi:kumamolisin